MAAHAGLQSLSKRVHDKVSSIFSLDFSWETFLNYAPGKQIPSWTWWSCWVESETGVEVQGCSNIWDLWGKVTGKREMQRRNPDTILENSWVLGWILNGAAWCKTLRPCREQPWGGQLLKRSHTATKMAVLWPSQRESLLTALGAQPLSLKGYILEVKSSPETEGKLEINLCRDNMDCWSFTYLPEENSLNVRGS